MLPRSHGMESKSIFHGFTDRSDSERTIMRKSQILNIGIDNLPLSECLQRFKKGVLFTPNVDHLIKLQTDREFYDNYLKADLVVCDSKIVQYASRFLGEPIVEKISGSDFFPAFYTYHRNNPEIRIFLLGTASGEIVEAAKDKINGDCGRNIVVEAHSPSFGFENDVKENLWICDRINQSGATVLAMGVGSPKQEKWIMRYKDKIPGVTIFMGIGATIDFEAGHVKRAPKWMSDAGLEWLYRILIEPRRLWKRYLIDDMPFFWLILKQKLGIYKNPWKN